MMKMKNVFMLICCLTMGVQAYVMAGKGTVSSGQENRKAEISGKLKPGDPSPEFRAIDVNGKPLSLKSLKGKYVYIDLWATWCGPCLGEVPHFQALEKKMHGKKIVFASISTDTDFKLWKEFVKKSGMTGIQLNFDGNKRFLELYGVTSIPRFILLDKKGHIINMNMTRPSDPETEKTLKSLKGI